MGRGARARILPAAGIVALGFMLAGCASSGPQSGEHHARYRVGHPSYRAEPYQVKGVWYTPKVDYSYDETGTASWYGPGFDGQPTADGEIYDMNQVSAAHKTLPLPSVVEVTNLQNGRALRVRVNDRGPFVDGRLIDMSRRSAQLLGFEGSGTAPVRVKIVKDESIRVAQAAMRGELGAIAVAQAAPSYGTTTSVARTAPAAAPAIEPRPITQIAAAGPPSLRAAQIVGEPLPVAAPSPAATQSPAATPEPAPAYPIAAATAPRRDWPSLIGQAHAEPLHPQIASLAAPAPRPVAAPMRNSGRIFVQAGAFAVPENAQRVRARIAALGSVEIVPTSGSGVLYRVRVGPVASEAAAARLLSKVVDSGYPGARVISE